MEDESFEKAFSRLAVEETAEEKAKAAFDRLLEKHSCAGYVAPIAMGRPRCILLLHERKEGYEGEELCETERFLRELFLALELRDVWVIDASPSTATPKGKSAASPNRSEAMRNWIKDLRTELVPELLLYTAAASAYFPRSWTWAYQVIHPSTTANAHGGRSKFITQMGKYWTSKFDRPDIDRWTAEANVDTVRRQFNRLAAHLHEKGVGEYKLLAEFAQVFKDYQFAGQTKSNRLTEFRKLVNAKEAYPRLSMSGTKRVVVAAAEEEKARGELIAANPAGESKDEKKEKEDDEGEGEGEGEDDEGEEEVEDEKKKGKKEKGEQQED